LISDNAKMQNLTFLINNEGIILLFKLLGSSKTYEKLSIPI
jgi:hypothetical protein